MKITFDNQKELDIYVTNKILDAHREWCTKFDLIIIKSSSR